MVGRYYMVAEMPYLKKISQAMSVALYVVTMVDWRLKYFISHFWDIYPINIQDPTYLGRGRVSQNDR